MWLSALPLAPEAASVGGVCQHCPEMIPGISPMSEVEGADDTHHGLSRQHKMGGFIDPTRKPQQYQHKHLLTMALLQQPGAM